MLHACADCPRSVTILPFENPNCRLATNPPTKLVIPPSTEPTSRATMKVVHALSPLRIRDETIQNHNGLRHILLLHEDMILQVG